MMKAMVSRGLFLMMVLLSAPVSAGEDLIGMLTSQLGVSEQQASGGLGALLATAEPNMSAEGMNSLSGIIPNMDGLLASGAQLLGGDGASSGTSSLLGGLMGGNATSLLGLNDAFSSLGLDSAMVAQFSQVLLDYVNSEGGQALMQQLQTALL
ncbi:DUF2780 domain-containing protein [Ferrimonas sp. SCSIO 43195]|uniref:DUF2780 domain-containing protein n=1 Tax=Ferrimonas sp. SCSIO 43195 TaxID=2822844 RepID=UPI002075463F|nr:DUF2780 domain-containing protein [Ferrimonas sp. SCSIO 43195]USD36364.1 DUF2780 domain-containing protein [Ferrimonas sp. SCSIO 43195]